MPKSCSFPLNFQSSVLDKNWIRTLYHLFDILNRNFALPQQYEFWTWFRDMTAVVCWMHFIQYFLNPSGIWANSNGFRCYLLHSVTVVINLKGLQPRISQPCWYLSLIFLSYINIALFALAALQYFSCILYYNHDNNDAFLCFFINVNYHSCQVGGLVGLVIGSVAIQ